MCGSEINKEMWNIGFHNEGRDSQKMDERNYDRRVLVEQRKEREVAVTKKPI